MTVSVVRDEFPVNHAPINEVSCGGAEVNHSGDHRRCRAFAIRRKNASGATERAPLGRGCTPPPDHPRASRPRPTPALAAVRSSSLPGARTRGRCCPRRRARL